MYGADGLVRHELISEAVDAFVVSVREIGVPIDELLELVKYKYETARPEHKEAEQ